MIFIGRFKYRLHISIARANKFFDFPFTYVSDSPALFFGDFIMHLYSVDSDEAMKR